MSRRCSDEFDLIYADAWPGKYVQLEAAVRLLKSGGIYILIVGDMLPQPNWPSDHAPNVASLLHTLNVLPGRVTTSLSCATGVVLRTRAASRETPM